MIVISKGKASSYTNAASDIPSKYTCPVAMINMVPWLHFRPHTVTSLLSQIKGLIGRDHIASHQHINQDNFYQSYSRSDYENIAYLELILRVVEVQTRGKAKWFRQAQLSNHLHSFLMVLCWNYTNTRYKNDIQV